MAKMSDLFLTVFLFFLAISTCKSAQFCNIQCQKNRISSPGVPCDDFPNNNCEFSTEWDSPTYDTLAILREHNSYRSFIAQGLHTFLFEAANMKELVWDKKLEDLAKRWVSRCQRPNEDFCKNEEFLNGLVISIDDGNRSTPTTGEYFKVPHVKSWFNEGQDMDSDSVNDYKFDEQTARFSQIIWAETERVGCTVVTYKPAKDTERESLVCMYAPPGNREGWPIYKMGNMSSQCPEGFRAPSTFKGLCGAESAGARKEVGRLAAILITVLMTFLHCQ